MLKKYIIKLTKAEIENYISENYENLLELANYITKGHAAGDLLNDIILDVLSRDKYSQHLHNCYNLYNYFYASMRRQTFSTNSKYYKNYKTHSYELFDELRLEYNQNDADNIINFIQDTTFFVEEIDKNVKQGMDETLAKNENALKNLTYKTIFLDYYFPLDTNSSLRATAKRFNISFSGVRRIVNRFILEMKIKGVSEKRN